MNKLELIETLKAKTGLTKNEAAAAVREFSDEMSTALATGDGVASKPEGSVQCTLKITSHIPAGIPKPVRRWVHSEPEWQ